MDDQSFEAIVHTNSSSDFGGIDPYEPSGIIISYFLGPNTTRVTSNQYTTQILLLVLAFSRWLDVVDKYDQHRCLYA